MWQAAPRPVCSTRATKASWSQSVRSSTSFCTSPEVSPFFQMRAARARVIVHLAGLEGQRQRLVVHVREHQRRVGAGLDGDDRDEPEGVETRRQRRRLPRFRPCRDQPDWRIPSSLLNIDRLRHPSRRAEQLRDSARFRRSSPMAFSGLSLSLTAGRPLALDGLATSEIGDEAGQVERGAVAEIIGEVGAPAEGHAHLRPRNGDRSVRSVSMSSPSEKIRSLRCGSRPCARHQSMISSPPEIGGALSGRNPVQSATQSGRVAQEGGGAEGVGQNDRADCRRNGASSRAAPDRARRSSSSSVSARAASTIGSSWALVPTASRSLSMASRTLEVPVNLAPSPSFSASTHQRCHRKEWRRRVPKSEIDRFGQLLQPLDLFPELGLGAGIDDIERERAEVPQGRARAQFVDDGEGRDFPHGGFDPGAVEIELELAVADCAARSRAAGNRRARRGIRDRRSACARQSCCRRARSFPSW